MNILEDCKNKIVIYIQIFMFYLQCLHNASPYSDTKGEHNIHMELTDSWKIMLKDNITPQGVFLVGFLVMVVVVVCLWVVFFFLFFFLCFVDATKT